MRCFGYEASTAVACAGEQHQEVLSVQLSHGFTSLSYKHLHGETCAPSFPRLILMSVVVLD